MGQIGHRFEVHLGDVLFLVELLVLLGVQSQNDEDGGLPWLFIRARSVRPAVDTISGPMLSRARYNVV